MGMDPLDRFVSRDVLVSILLAVSLGKVLEYSNLQLTTDQTELLVLWIFETLALLLVYLLWGYIDALADTIFDPD
jgi:hypothetical protein